MTIDHVTRHCQMSLWGGGGTITPLRTSNLMNTSMVTPIFYHDNIPSVHRIFSCHLPTHILSLPLFPGLWVTCGESADNAGIVQLTGSMSQARPWLSWERGGTDVRRKNNSLFSLELEASKHANTETDQEDGVERSRIYLLSQVHQNHNSAQKPLMEKTRTSQERSSTKKNLKKSTMRWQGGMDLQHNQV